MTTPSHNEATLIGVIETAPVSRTTNGGLVIRFQLKTTKKRRDQNTNQVKEQARLLPIVATGKIASKILEGYEAGDLVFIHGELTVTEFAISDSQKYPYMEVEVIKIEKLSGAHEKKDGQTNQSVETEANHSQKSEPAKPGLKPKNPEMMVQSMQQKSQNRLNVSKLAQKRHGNSNPEYSSTISDVTY